MEREKKGLFGLEGIEPNAWLNKKKKKYKENPFLKEKHHILKEGY